jgi:hypothetical protein
MTATVDRTSEAVTQLVEAIAALAAAQVAAEVARLAPQLLTQVAEQPPATAATLPDWVTVAEAAKHARRGEATIRRALSEYVSSRGKRGLRGHQEAANCSWRIRPADLDAWIANEPPKRRRPA